MKKQFAFVAALLLTTQALEVYAILPKKDAASESTSLFLKGKMAGQRMIEFWKKALKGGEAGLPFDFSQEQDLFAVAQILEQSDPQTEAHKNAFKGYRSYYEGLAATFTNFSIENFIKENKIEATMAEQLVKGRKFVLEAANTITSASTYAAAMHALITLVNGTLEPAFEELATQQSLEDVKPAALSDLPQGSALLAEKYYQRGVKAGEKSVEMLHLQAQGKEVPFQTLIDSMSLDTTNELTVTFSKNPTSAESKKAFIDFRLFLLGLRTALEKFDVEKNTTQYKTAKMNADKLKFTHLTLMNGLAMIINASDAQSATLAYGRLIMNLFSGYDSLFYEDEQLH